MSTISIFTDICFILLHLGLFIFNFHVTNKNLFAPSSLLSFIWVAVVSLRFICVWTVLPKLYPLNLDTYMVVFVGICLFSFGCIVMQSLEGAKKENINIGLYPELSILIRIGLLLIILVGLPFYIKAAFKLFINSQVEDFFVGLRAEISYGDEDLGPIKYLTTIAFVTFAVNLFSYFRGKRKSDLFIVVITTAVTLSYAVFATGRTYFLLMLSIYAGISYWMNPKFSPRKFIKLIGIFIFIFIAIGFIYGKGADAGDTMNQNTRSASQATAIYLVTPINALQQQLKYSKTEFSGENTLRFFIKLGEGLNILPTQKIKSLIQEYSFVPYSTNVYTIYSPYIKDYGKIYAWMMMFFYGLLHGWLYVKAGKDHSWKTILYYSFSCYPLIMTFYQDQYLTLLSTWVQVIFFLELIAILNKIIIRSDMLRKLSLHSKNNFMKGRNKV